MLLLRLPLSFWPKKITWASFSWDLKPRDRNFKWAGSSQNERHRETHPNSFSLSLYLCTYDCTAFLHTVMPWWQASHAGLVLHRAEEDALLLTQQKSSTCIRVLTLLHACRLSLPGRTLSCTIPHVPICLLYYCSTAEPDSCLTVTARPLPEGVKFIQKPAPTSNRRSLVLKPQHVERLMLKAFLMYKKFKLYLKDFLMIKQVIKK